MSPLTRCISFTCSTITIYCTLYSMVKIRRIIAADSKRFVPHLNIMRLFCFQSDCFLAYMMSQYIVQYTMYCYNHNPATLPRPDESIIIFDTCTIICNVMHVLQYSIIVKRRRPHSIIVHQEIRSLMIINIGILSVLRHNYRTRRVIRLARIYLFDMTLYDYQ